MKMMMVVVVMNGRSQTGENNTIFVSNDV